MYKIYQIYNDSFYKDALCELIPDYQVLFCIYNYLNINNLVVEISAQEFNRKTFESDYKQFFNNYINDARRILEEREKEIESNKRRCDEDVTIINMYIKGQELKGHIDGLNRKAKKIEDEITAIESKNGILLSSCYQKKTMIQKIISKFNRFIKRKEVTIVENKIEGLKAQKRTIERKIKMMKEKYQNIQIQTENRFDEMTQEQLDEKKKSIQRDSMKYQTRIKTVQDILKKIDEALTVETVVTRS